MSEGRFVDWGLAERVALGLAGNGGGTRPFGQPDLDAAYADAVGLVLEYTRLRPREELPAPELVERAEWARLGLRTLRELSADLEGRISDAIALPGPLGSVARSLGGAAAGMEAGVAVGYGARKVLAQYDVALVDSDRRPRLVFVGPNLATAHAELGEEPGIFLRWIAIHESAHSVQFASVPWLRSHLMRLLDELIKGASARLDLETLRALARRLLRSDPRAAIRTVLRGDLPRLLAGPEEGRVLDRLQATMSVIEGHAEHVMDAAARRLDPGYARLRDRVELRRARRSGLGEAIARLLGLELKLRQYTLGKAFCDAVVADAGIDGLNAVWRGSESLPSLEELEKPRRWLDRVGGEVPAEAA